MPRKNPLPLIKNSPVVAVNIGEMMHEMEAWGDDYHDEIEGNQNETSALGCWNCEESKGFPCINCKHK